MNLKNTITTYGSIAKGLHWFIAIVVVVLLGVGFVMVSMEAAPPRFFIYNTHKIIGIFILAVMLLRLLWSVINPRPRLPEMATWEKTAVRLSHLLLYITLFAMPLSGWIMSTAAGFSPTLFGAIIAFPGIVKNEMVATIASSMHRFFAWTLIVLISLHILGALRHYFIKKDNVLQSMLPKF